jgi:hypothetical protein
MGIEKFFQFSFYITIPAETMEELDNITKLEATLASLLLFQSMQHFRWKKPFKPLVPVAMDKLPNQKHEQPALPLHFRLLFRPHIRGWHYVWN